MGPTLRREIRGALATRRILRGCRGLSAASGVRSRAGHATPFFGGLAYHGVSGPKQRLCPPRVQPFSHDEGNRCESHASSVCRGGHRLDP